jgi:hypothetical protein
MVYGAGSVRYSYRGYEVIVIEHNGGVPGFNSWVSRLPNNNKQQFGYRALVQ